jgi:fumarylacetoacetase
MNIQKSWITVPEHSDFPLQNIPFGVIKKEDGSIVNATIIGNTVIDLAALYELGYFSKLGIKENVFAGETLNNFIALGKPTWRSTRDRVIELFEEPNTELQKNDIHKKQVLFPVTSVQNLLPVEVGDYTDFYSSEEHATNVGTMFRDPKNALLPNWKHIPVGYHGRSSSIVVSGTNIHRPLGQTKPKDADNPIFGPTKLFDFELEMAFVTGAKTNLGDRIAVENADDAIFGILLFNDLSARDMQAWEYVPLGPFLAKSFGSVVSPWIVTLDALAPFKTKGRKQEPEVLPYLKTKGDYHYDINLEVYIQPENGEEDLVCESNMKYLYWSMNQQLAHQTVNGCNINVGDMYASGTISGPDKKSYGSMLELTWRGTDPIKLSNGEERKFINDNDSIIMRGFAEKDGLRIGFGESRTKVLPAKDF